MSLNWLAILVSVVASFAIGSIWYGPLFGKTWAKSMGFENPPSGSEIAKGSALNVLGTFLIAFVLAFEIGLFRPSAWNHEVPDAAPHVYGFIYGFLTWLGFVVPVLLNGVAFERKSWKAFTIGAVFQLISLQVMAMILAYWR
ncbi:DUF1761 domain-containing protein [bacterium]|nr:DUF1761 domain-containing protein [bacterium]